MYVCKSKSHHIMKKNTLTFVPRNRFLHSEVTIKTTV